MGHYWLHCVGCEDLGRYYRYMTMKRHGRFAPIMRPKWGPHVTIVAGKYELSNYEKIKRFDGVQASFECDNELIMTNEKHCWMPIRCDRFLDIRESLGLPRHRFVRLHLTFGVMPGEENMPAP